MRLTLGMLRGLVAEGAMHVRQPKTPRQQRAFIDLVRWVSTREGSGVEPDEASQAIAAAKRGDWTQAMDLLSTYYFMQDM